MMRDGVVQLEGPREEVLEKMRATAGRPAQPAPQPTTQPQQRQSQPPAQPASQPRRTQ